jgi:fumarate hydratase class II
LDVESRSSLQTVSAQSYMNANEVIANRANEASRRASRRRRSAQRPRQSRAVLQRHLPTACTCRRDEINQRLVPALRHLRRELAARRELADVVKIGRTHLQDATPRDPWARNSSGYAAQVLFGITR